jgi:hypothetical protein
MLAAALWAVSRATVKIFFSRFFSAAAVCRHETGGRMVKLSADLVMASPQFTNTLKEREIDLRGS